VEMKSAVLLASFLYGVAADSCSTNTTEPACTGHEFWPCSLSWSSELLLILLYGMILGFGAKLIGDGSEMLMEILDPGVIGALLLPVLGAVPDSAVVVLSAAIVPSCVAQSQIAVGMGTLAGSTIMLLTVTWSASLFVGRCDFRGGEAVDKTLTRKFDLFHSGVSVDPDTKTNARIMLVTSLAYFLVQGIAFAHLKNTDSSEIVHSVDAERYFSLAGAIICFAMLVAYCIYQLLNPKLQERKMQKAKEDYVVKMAISRMTHLLQAKTGATNEGGDMERAPLNPQPAAPVDARKVGLAWKKKAAEKAESRVDINKPKEDSEEEDEKPSGTKTQIAVRAIVTLLIGTALVSVFSDPIVTVITNFADTIHIPPFYVSFLITPYCSNASELISSLMFAAGKKRKNASLTYGQIYGAATMNNTMVLGIFFTLVYAKGLYWEFSAESLAIFFVTWCVGLPAAFKTNFPTIFFFWGAFLYPFSIFLVYALENWAHLE
jgi:Ca2+/Na+ antiporter